MDNKKIVYDIFSSALSAVDPYSAVSGALTIVRNAIFPGKCNRIIVIGFGKAACQMAAAVKDSIGADSVIEGIVLTKYGHAQRTEAKKIRSLEDKKTSTS